MAYYPPPAYSPYPPPYAQPAYGYDWQQQQPQNYYQPQAPQPPLPAPQSLPPPPSQPVAQPQASAPVAYTRVTPKSSSVATGASAQDERKSGWPDSLRSFTQRAFIGASTPAAKAQLQVFLKELINTAQKQGELWTKDWDSMPLPDCCRKPEDRDRASLSAASTKTSASIMRSASPFRMTFSKQSQKRARSPSPDSSRSSTPLKALTKRERKLLRKQEQERKRVVQSLAATHHVKQDMQVDFHDVERERARARRFGNGSATGAVSRRPQKDYYSRAYDDWDEADVYDSYEDFQSASAVRGTCQQLEKSYFRLTSKPDPSAVRPEPVLRKALARLVGLLRSKQVTYFYAADQFKGMRQDCTVQHLCNALSASIYEAHARCALEYGDTAEFNQCQAQLLQHYKAGIAGAQAEFTAYRLLHQSIHAGKGNHAGILNCLQSISAEDAEHPFVQHARQVSSALAVGDCMQVCLLYSSAPNMGQALLDMVLPRLRLTALKILAKAFLPHLSIAFVATRLAFLKPKEISQSSPPTSSANHEALPGSSAATFFGRHAPEANEGEGETACAAWLREHGAILVSAPGGKAGLVMDCKASVGQLRAPEQSSAAAHGPDLAIDDFLARAVA